MGSDNYAALFGVAVVLLFITLAVNSAAVMILSHIRERQMGSSGKTKGSARIPLSRDGFDNKVRIGIFLIFTGLLFVVLPVLVALIILAGAGAIWFLKGRLNARHAEIVTLTLAIIAAIVVMFMSVMFLQEIVITGITPSSWESMSRWLVETVSIMPAVLVILAGACAIWFLRGRLNPRQKEKVAFSLVIASAGIVLLALIIILQDIIVHGLPAISWEFLTQGPKNLGRSGGIYPAIVGTLYLVAGAILFALPLGMGAAIYLVEYTREGKVTRLIRTTVDLLNGTPSIVFGLFGLTFLVYYLNFGVCLLAGQITLGLMVLPTIIRATEETLKTIPQSLREGSLALGATRWQTIYKVVLPPAIPGIVTGTILSIGRAAGETAPIMFTAVVFSQRYLPSSVFDPVMALPYHLYILATNVPGSSTNKYGTALVLLILVIGIYSGAIFIRNHFSRKLRG